MPKQKWNTQLKRDGLDHLSQLLGDATIRGVEIVHMLYDQKLELICVKEGSKTATLLTEECGASSMGDKIKLVKKLIVPKQYEYLSLPEGWTIVPNDIHYGYSNSMKKHIIEVLSRPIYVEMREW